MITKSYRELSRLNTFLERFEYLRTSQLVGEMTFNGSRWINQEFYHSSEWKKARDFVIVRDNGCDLGVSGYEIVRDPRHKSKYDTIYVHHINPVSIDDLLEMRDICLDPDNLICCSFETHQAIHYGDASLLKKEWTERKPNDTIPWR